MNETLKEFWETLQYTWERLPLVSKITLQAIAFIPFFLLLKKGLAEISPLLSENIFNNYIKNYLYNFPKLQDHVGLEVEDILYIFDLSTFIITFFIISFWGHNLYMFIKHLWNKLNYLFISILVVIGAFLISYFVISNDEYLHSIIFNDRYIYTFEGNIFKTIKYYIEFGSEKNWLGAEALSNILRNDWLFLVGIVVLCLTIWGKIMTRKQLEFANEQIILTRQTNQNERFMQAMKLLGDIANPISRAGGLLTLRDLAKEHPTTEHIRCMESIRFWLYLQRSLKNINPEAKKALDKWYFDEMLAFKILTSGWTEEQHNIALTHIKHDVLLGWPDFKDIDLSFLEKSKCDFGRANLNLVNLEKANLEFANFNEAYLMGTNFANANITMAKMEHVEGLTANQILKAKWFQHQGVGGPPRLSKKLKEEIMKTLKGKEWLEIPCKFEDIINNHP